MLSNDNLPNGFWVEALATFVHLINRSPNKVLDKKVPEEVCSRKPTSYKHLRVFGCEAFCHVLKHLRDKLSPKSKKCVFLGYGEPGEMGFGLWDPESKKILCSSDVYFNEEKMHKKSIKTVEICRVVFQEDGQVHNRQIQVDNAQNAPQVQERVEEQQVEQAQPLL